MSLLDESFEDAYIVDKRTEEDGRGGVKTVYVRGADIKAAFSFDASTEARVAEQQGTSNRFTITTRKAVNLRYHDIVHRVKDDKVFRVTSDGDDNYTPASAALNMRQVEAEEWEIPSNG